MGRLTFTKEQREVEKVGYARYLHPEILSEWDKKLAAYENTDLEPEEVTALQAKVATLEAERDAAVMDLKRTINREYGKCDSCLYREYMTDCEECAGGLRGTKWQWRGVKEIQG